MGVLISNPLDKMKENMEKNSENMFNKQKELILKQRQLQMATQFAMGKDRFLFYQAFYFTALIGLIPIAIKTKRYNFLLPLVPLSFNYAYQWDMYYGNKMERIKRDAENLIREYPDMFFPPENNMIVTIEEYKSLIIKY